MPIVVLACLRARMLALHFCIGSTYAAKHKDKVRPKVERVAWAMCESGQVIVTAMTLLSASLRFALRVSCQLFKIAPGDFVAPERRLRTREMVHGCTACGAKDAIQRQLPDPGEKCGLVSLLERSYAVFDMGLALDSFCCV